MKVLICLSLFVAATVALHLPPRPLPKRDHHDDPSFPRPEPPVHVIPPHIPDHPHPALEELFEDVHDFMKILPHKDIRQMVKTAFKNDEELRQTVRYMRSPQFHYIMKEIGHLPEVQELFKPFHDHHIETEDLAIRGFAAIDEEFDVQLLPTPARDASVTGGLCGLIDRIIAILPHNELRELHREKVANGGVFAEIATFLTSDDFQQRLHTVLQSERFLELDAALRERGVCLDKFIELPMNMFGFH